MLLREIYLIKSPGWSPLGLSWESELYYLVI